MTWKSLWLFLAATTALLADGRTLFRSPSVSKTHIVFVYADDLWIAPRAGGEAIRLTTGQGSESNPVFSPDGATVAFDGEYDGNRDVFVVATAGGVPKRLTFHPQNDSVDGWTPDGKRVLFHNSGSWVDNKPRTFTVDLNGGFPSEVPLPIATEGSFSPDGKQLAYLPYERADEAWKRYRGGRATTIWIANLADSSVVKIPRTDSNDNSPMWVGNQVYFLSDRSGPYTLFSYDTGSKKVTQLLEAKGEEKGFASAVVEPGNDDAPAERASVLVALQLFLRRREEVLRIEGVIARELEQTSMEHVCARLGRDVHGGARAVEFGRVGVLLNAELLQRVH